MIDFPGYQAIEKFYESSRSVLYRARRCTDLVPVILKISNRESQSPQEIDRFQLEYDILRSLNIQGVVTAYALETYPENSVIVLEDFGGKSLPMWLVERTFNLVGFLNLAIRLTSILGEIHQHNIIHKDINPSNIVFNPTTGQVKIVDFGLATILSPENPLVREPNLLEGTLAYISPEQTGRMNRSIDYRTDFYSLGVTFYELLSYRLPFETTDALELVHCHLAREPLPLHQIDPAIPLPLSDLVMKLMAKNAVDRYQTTDAILVDLQACVDRIDRTSSIAEKVTELDKTSTITKNHLASTSNTTGSAALDLAALMKASQALAGEIVLDKLLAKLMTIAIENSGAQRGCLLLQSNGELEIAAIVEPQNVSILPAISLDSEAGKNLVSLAIVNYVASTQESIVLNRAVTDSRFDRDAYIRARQPKSILCTPLIYQGKRAGILYLENNLTTDIFTPQRLEVIQFLSTQAAISLDNAQLYNQLELRVQQRTIELTQTNDRLQSEILERQKSEQILRSIVEGTVSATGVDFFRSLVRSLAQALDVRYAFISECMDAPPTRVRSFAFWQGNEFGNEFEYDLHGTPCERIIGSNSYQCFPAQIQSLFPEEKDELEAMEAQSYAGIPLLTSMGDLLGHLAVLDDKEMESNERTQAILEIFAARAAAEMERLQVEDALRVSETKFSTAFRSSPDAIAISTLNDGCYIEINDSCLRMLGYHREEMLGRSTLELGVWANPADRIAIAQQLQQQGTVSNLEISFRRKSGEIFPTLFSAEAIYLEDEPCLLAVAADITLLKQAEKALARLAEIGELAATIVHEVRNPLTTILMGLNAFKKLQLSERFQEYLALSLDEADRLQRLLSQILLYSKPQTLDRSRLELNSFILETLSTLQTIPAALGKQLEFIPIEPIYVLVDRDKFKQVIINLIVNACEAIDIGDVITTKLDRTEHHRVCLQIHNGTPIPADILPRLTQPFFTTKASGTGLGLAIVKRIVEAHDGEFRIESGEEIGSIVTVKLPTMLS
ncbi:MAG: GAF domain-containing protein [Microcoleus sp. PH2017_40_RAT_O_B]|uniref:protein kinase domain-containing protein n=1 Tax=unclassified Microcoleus TaxID=2642155 RepID=UPI001D6347CC|nr:MULTISPECIES: GAF domain-containing protein [unclassified Microcoleus]MCC3576099.1 GAF domain-containing protein [Microcoleus sp. PH2017_34_RAT_O_A]MCC3613908.1 GAF domain-containing protein [Microcoleus sp. PH2017_40_RAT_O_B]